MILLAALLPFISVAPDHWTFELHGGLSDVRTGKHALHMACEGGTTEVTQELPAIDGGREVSAAVWIRGSHANARLLLRLPDSTGEDSRAFTPAGARWSKLTVRARVPANARVRLVLQARGDGHITFDDVSAAGVMNGGFEEGMRAWAAGRDGTGAAWVNDATFVPWGFNYDRTIHEGKDLVLEEAPIEKIDSDFQIARRLGANSLRIFLQLSRFMPRFLEMDPAALGFLDQVIARARKYDLKLDITGLSHIVGIPSWYAEKSADEITRAERTFWSAIAKRYADEPVILDYDLQNEPVIRDADADMKAVGCFVMSEKRPFCYVNSHRLDPAAGREETARRWTAAMVEAIREYDKQHLITIGMLPTAGPMLGFPNPAFNIRTLAPLLDFISLHYYPNHPATDILRANQDRLEMLLRYAGQFGKPVVMEEWFPIYPFGAKLGEGDWFPHAMEASRGNAAGWFTFYHYALKCANCAPPNHVRQFSESAATVRSSVLQRAPATTRLAIDPESLWKSKGGDAKLLEEYQALRRAGALPDFTWENQTR